MKLSFLFLTVLFSSSLSFARPPEQLKFKPLKFAPPKIERRVLSQGTTVFLLPDHELPLINITAYIRTGSMYDPLNQIGLASLCSNLMRSGGTQSRKVEEIDNTLEFLGASVETGMDTEYGSASLSVLTQDLNTGLEIFADVLRRPTFDKAKADIEKSKLIESIRRRNDEAFQIARRTFRHLLYGKQHPLSRVPEIQEVKKISRKDLIKFHRKYYHPNNLMLAVSGDFDPNEIVQKLESVFKDWKPQPVDFPSIPTAQLQSDPPIKRTVGVVDKPLNQTSVLFGHLGIKRHNPDRFAMEVVNEMLGGGALNSRLYKEVRSRQGLAYWVGSSFSEPWDYGIIAAGCQTKNETAGQAIQSILKEIERIRNEKASIQELQTTKDTIINSFVFRYASSHAIVTQTMALEYFGYPQDYLETYTSKIAQITAEDIQRTAKKYFQPERFSFAIVGWQKDFDVDLSTFGVIQLLDITIKE